MAVLCGVILLALTAGTHIFWQVQLHQPSRQRPRISAELIRGDYLTAQKLKGLYKFEAQLLTLNNEGKVELLQADWAAPLSGWWQITPQQTIIVEIPHDRLWQQREFKVSDFNLIDLQDNSAWRQQQ